MFKHRIILTIFIISIFFFMSGCDIADTFYRDLTGNYEDENKNNDNINISKIEVDYFIDSANYDDGGSREHQGEFTSIAGTSTYENYVYHTIFNNPEVLGKLITGEMKITFKEENGNKIVDVFIEQEREWNWNNNAQDYQSWQNYGIKCNNIPFNKSYVDDFDDDNLDEYFIGGSTLAFDTLKYNYQGIWGTNDGYELLSYTCGTRAYIKVKVHYE